MYEYNAVILRVIDGDTVQCRVDLGFHTHRVENIRVLHFDGTAYDAPETTLRGDTTEEEKAHGLQAKEFAEQLLPVGSAVRIKTHYDKTGKYGRFLGAITMHGGKDFAGTMTEAGYTKGE